MQKNQSILAALIFCLLFSTASFASKEPSKEKPSCGLEMATDAVQRSFAQFSQKFSLADILKDTFYLKRAISNLGGEDALSPSRGGSRLSGNETLEELLGTFATAMSEYSNYPSDLKLYSPKLSYSLEELKSSPLKIDDSLLSLALVDFVKAMGDFQLHLDEVITRLIIAFDALNAMETLSEHKVLALNIAFEELESSMIKPVEFLFLDALSMVDKKTPESMNMALQENLVRPLLKQSPTMPYLMQYYRLEALLAEFKASRLHIDQYGRSNP